MKVVECSFLPPSGFKAINVCGLVIHRKGASMMTDEDLNHEAIHTAQMREMLYVFFYIVYVLEWLCRLVRYWDFRIAYSGISFEREAYGNEGNLDYLSSRRHYAQWRGND